MSKKTGTHGDEIRALVAPVVPTSQVLLPICAGVGRGCSFRIPVCFAHGPQVNIELSDARSCSSARLSSPTTLADDTLLDTTRGAAWD
jgi:hypothetical protein